MSARWKPEEEWLLVSTNDNISAERKSLRYQVYETLRDLIIQHKIAPGTLMNEHTLACDLNVSQTTVRNALSLLEQENLIVRRKGKSAISIMSSNSDIENLYHFHYIVTKGAAVQAIETLSAEEYGRLLALAARADEGIGNAKKEPLNASKDELAFHRYLVDVAHNPFFSNAERQIQHRLQFYTMQLYHSKEFAECFSPRNSGHAELCDIYERGRNNGNLRLFDATLQLHMFRNLILDWGNDPPERKNATCLFHELFQYSAADIKKDGSMSFRMEFQQLTTRNPFISIQSAISVLILRALMDGRLQTGMNISISEIASNLNVSRNPVRDAISQLVRTGYLYKNEAGKLYPTENSAPKKRNMFMCRLIIEPYAGMLAVDRCTKSELVQIEKYLKAAEQAYENNDVNQFFCEDGLFHLAIVQASHNPYLIRLYQSILIFSRMSVFEAARRQQWTIEAVKERIKEHRAIFMDLKLHRKDRILQSSREHILNASKGCLPISDKMHMCLDKIDSRGFLSPR